MWFASVEQHATYQQRISSGKLEEKTQVHLKKTAVKMEVAVVLVKWRNIEDEFNVSHSHTVN